MEASADGVAATGGRDRRRRTPPKSVLVPLVVVGGILAVSAIVATTIRDGDESAAGSTGIAPGSTDDAPVSDHGERLIDTCGDIERPSIPGTDITVDPFTLEQEIELGREVRDLILASSTMSTDQELVGQLERLLRDVRPTGEIPFNVTLLDAADVNAFATPGGGIYFTTGIMNLMDDDELAFVMAHEIAHVACRHLAQQYEREALATAGLNAVLGTELDTEDLYADPAAAAVTSFLSLSFSRDDEREADLAALDLLERSDRPLSAAVDALSTLRDIEGVDPSDVETWFSTHPPTVERIDDLRAAIDER